MTSFYPRTDKPTLAYHHIKGENPSDLPPVIFLGGFKSDMEGSKALYLQEKCVQDGREYLRFDYSGHGESEGVFEEHVLSEWAQDAIDIINHCFTQPVILVGSSMGGWISLVLAKRIPQKICGLVGLAAAPDFTIWMENEMTQIQREELKNQGYFDLGNDYGDPYRISQALIDDGRALALLDKKINVNFPIHLINGKQDTDVPWQTAERIKDVFEATKVDITYIEDGDHRLSKPKELEIIWRAIKSVEN